MMQTLLNDMLETFNQGRPAKLGAFDIEDGVAKDGDGQKFDKERYPFYADQLLITCHNTAQPTVVSADGKTKIEPKEVQGGMLCLAVVTPMLTAFGPSYKLMVVQKVKDDGTKFAGGVKTTDDYIAMLHSAEEASEEAEEPTEPDEEDEEDGCKEVSEQSETEGTATAKAEPIKASTPPTNAPTAPVAKRGRPKREDKVAPVAASPAVFKTGKQAAINLV
jgi:hypothetical protein